MALALSPERAVHGRFGPYGGRYVPETLIAALDELARLYDSVRTDASFWGEFDAILRDYVGRPTPVTHAERLSAEVGATVLLKREDLNHTGAHKINNTVGQALLTKRMHLPLAQKVMFQAGLLAAFIAFGWRGLSLWQRLRKPPSA